MKTLQINISANDLTLLKENQYALCFACNEADAGYDVICHADMNYLCSVEFEFMDEYQIFCCQNIRNGEELLISTDPVPILPGQQITLDSTGVFSSVVSGTEPDCIELINNYGNLYPGFSRKISCNACEDFMPAFVAPYISVKGSFLLKPADNVLVWFQQYAKGSSFTRGLLKKIFNAGKSRAAEASLTDNQVCSLTYENGIWKK